MSSPAGPPFAISALRENEVETLAQLAREIWLQHYPGIITVRQIEYMLAQRYSVALITEQLRDPAVWWDKLEVDGLLAGFACCEKTQPCGDMKLDKLYVDGRYRGRGYGAAMIQHARQRAQREGCERLYLQVNRGNHDSVAVYRRAGFAIEKTVKVEIGGGFVMDDFVMSMRISGTGACA